MMNCRLVVLLLILLCLPTLAWAGDWAQFAGPNRTGHADSEKLAADWTSAQPQQLWSMSIGEGYAGVAVHHDLAYVFHRKQETLVLSCVAASDKAKQWETTWRATYGGGINEDRGPRCVPLIHEGRVYVFSANGDLHCVAAMTGKKLWTRRLSREYKSLTGFFGCGSSPIVAGGQLMVCLGGRQAGIVALDLESGETKWTSGNDKADYASPCWWPRGDQQNAIFISRSNVLGLDSRDGSVLFQFPFGKRGPTVNAATPILVGKDQLFVTASYGIGAKLISLANLADPQVVWESDDSLSSQYPTPVLHNGTLFGVHGREDIGVASLRAVDVKSGKVLWDKPGVGMAQAILADNKLLVVTLEGELILLEPSAEAYRELGRIKVMQGTTRAQPALSNGRLFMRDTTGNVVAWKLP